MKTSMLGEFATFNDIWQLIKSHIEMWFEEMLVPDVDEFFDRFLPALAKFKKARRFIYRVEGLTLQDVDTIELGSKTVRRQFSWDLLEGIESDDARMRECVEKEFGGQCVIEGREVGSRDKAQRKFVFGAEMAISVLRLCGCLLYRAAITHTHIRLVDRSLGARGTASSLSWAEEERRLCFTRYLGKEQSLTLSLDMLQYLTEHCFFKQLFQCLEKEDRSELEDTINRAIYWFGEAHKDSDDTMKFVKLWSCVESFFSIEKDQSTVLNATGLSAVMTCGGYSVVDVADYGEFKKKVTHLYDLRSKALHRAYHGHIGWSELEDFAQIVAWLITSMVSLTLKGYTELREVLQQCRRIDEKESKTP